ncbi:MAG: thermitase [Blastocatellia bacterium]|nr:thermitase [Blastocatellia bacterium]
MPSKLPLFRHKLNLLWIIFALLWMLPQPAGVRAQGSGSSNDYVPGEVVVKLASAADLAAITTQYGLATVPLDQFGSRPIYRLKIADSESVPQKVTRLKADPQLRVVYAEPNYLANAPEASKPSWGVGDSYSTGGTEAAYRSQWAAQSLQLSAAHNVTRGAGVTVAVLDTGVDRTHPLLAGRLVGGFDFVDFDNDPSEVGDAEHGPYGHGTHVAGLVALVAPDAKIMPIRVLDRNGVGNIWVLAEALAYAVDPDGNPNTHDGASVINLSLSTLRKTNLLSSLLDRACSDFEDNDPSAPIDGKDYNVVVVAAAGNRGQQINEYPAAENISGLLAVAASTQADQLATFSTYGSWIKVAAPGDLIMSTVPGGQFGTWRGTSMASPLTAGEVALVRAAYPNLPPSKVIAQVEHTSARIEASIHSRINAGNALTNRPEDEPTLGPNAIQFADDEFEASEGAGRILVTVVRSAPLTDAVTVDYSLGLQGTSTDSAKQLSDFIITSGTLRFAPGETSKTFPVLINQDSYHETKETAKLVLSNVTGSATLGGLSVAELEIEDDDPIGTQGNVIDENFNFVRQQYHDFLSREPDQGGLDYWSTEIVRCGTDAHCLNQRRRDVSAAFFVENEFQSTGYFVYKLEKVSFNRRPVYKQFLPEVQEISRNAQALGTETSKRDFANAWVERPEFHSRFDVLGNAQFVDELYRNAELAPDAVTRNRQVDDLEQNRRGRGEILREVAETPELHARQYNSAFVLMQYFGYLRREPDAGGYDFWLGILNNRLPNDMNGYKSMVCAFITSREYQERFSATVTRRDDDCAP